MTSTPEVAYFVPEWRVKRRKIAIGVTAVAVGFFAWGVVDLVGAATSDSATIRAMGMAQYVRITVKTAASIIALIVVWRWANARDPRDVANPLARH